MDARRRNTVASVVSYLIVLAVAVRGLVEYPEQRTMLAVVLGVFVLLMLLEPLFARSVRTLGPIYLLIQTALMIGLYLTTPLADYWAILLLPACIFALRHYSRVAGFLWVGLFAAAMSVMLVLGEGMPSALQYIIVYLAAYTLLSSYSLMLKQTETAQQRSQSLLVELQETNRQLKESADSVRELAVVNERNRLARDLHDSVTQSIFSMTLITRTALLLQEKDPGKVTEQLEQLQELANGALGEMRALIYELRPMSVAEHGLVPVLRRHLEEVRRRDQVIVDLSAAEDQLPLEAAVQQELFRVIQEALNNVAKHAKTDRARVEIRASSDQVLVTVADGGVGFDRLNDSDGRTRFGLESMTSRVTELGGSVDIASSAGSGTTVTVCVPLSSTRKHDEQDKTTYRR